MNRRGARMTGWGPVAGVVLMALAPSSAQAQEVCRWENQDWPTLRTLGRTVEYEGRFWCPGSTQGELKVEFFVVRGKERVAIGDGTKKVKIPHRWGKNFSLRDTVGPYGYCTLTPTFGRRDRRFGINGGRQFAAFPLTVQAVVRGTGNLAGLKSQQSIEVLCERCKHIKGGRSYIRFKEGRSNARELTSATRVTTSMSKDWWRCVSPGAFLELRYFGGDTQNATKSSIRPVYVQRDVQTQVTVEGDKALLDVAAPHKALCRTGVPHIAIEVWGKGDLAHLGGGGRRHFPLKCP